MKKKHQLDLIMKQRRLVEEIERLRCDALCAHAFYKRKVRECEVLQQDGIKRYLEKRDRMFLRRPLSTALEGIWEQAELGIDSPVDLGIKQFMIQQKNVFERLSREFKDVHRDMLET